MKISLTDIGHDLIGQEINVSILPQTISGIQAVPIELFFECAHCGHSFYNDISADEYFNDEIKLIKKGECPTCQQKKLMSSYSRYTNCFVIQAIHPLKDVRLDHDDKTDKKIRVIEESRSQKPVTSYYLTETYEDIPFGVLNAEGYLCVDQKKKPMKYYLILNDIIPEKDYFLNYRITKKDEKEFKKYFTDSKDLYSDIADTIAPSIIGRELPKFFTALTQHSVLYIRPDTLGLLSGLFAGDSRCGKTVIILDSILYLSPLGCEYATAETSTRTGISYNLKQVGDSWEIEWGILPLCDKMYVGLDGLHAWGLDEIMQLREARSQGYIRVRRSVKADHPARVRVVGAVNLGQKVLTYPTRWNATWDSAILNHVDRNRWDFIFVFGENDINKSDINKRHKDYKQGKVKRKIPVDVWRKHVIWAWQITPDRIKIKKQTYEKIEQIVNEIHSKFIESRIKPFTNEFFNTFEKMTIAYACLTHSTDKNNNLIVKPEHAEYIKEKIESYINHLELEKVKLTENFIPKDELDLLLTELQDKNKERILLFIGNNGGCKQKDISNYLRVDKSYISKELDWFQQYQLISGRTNITLTETGAELNRKLLDILDKSNKEKDKKVESTNLSTKTGHTKKIKNNEGGVQVDKKVESTFNIADIEKTMNKHPATDWNYKEIADEMDLSGSQSNDLNYFLSNITSDPKNSSSIRRGNEDGFYHLTKINSKRGDA